MGNLKNDLFVIPHDNDYIVYSPLRGAVFSSNAVAIGIINKYILGETLSEQERQTKLFKHLYALDSIDVVVPRFTQTVDMSSRVTFIPTQACNLACSYCYAHKAHSKNTLKKETIKLVVENSFLAGKSSTARRFSFIGGGEPLLAWDLIVFAVNYIKECSRKCSTKSKISIITNATVLDVDKVQFIKNNDINISVSSEILPDIQNKQRSFLYKNKNSFEIVDSNIKILLSHHIYPRIRSTITEENVDLLPEMVWFCIKNYPGIKTLHFEPVTDFLSASTLYYKRYMKSFSQARDVGKANAVSVYNSISSSLEKLRMRFCAGEYCITPTSKIVSCHRMSSNNDKYFKEFCYGRITDTIQISKEDLFNVINMHTVQNKCLLCFAKWHCAGGCPAQRIMYSELQQKAYCEFVKETIKHLLFDKIQKKGCNIMNEIIVSELTFIRNANEDQNAWHGHDGCASCGCDDGCGCDDNCPDG